MANYAVGTQWASNLPWLNDTAQMSPFEVDAYENNPEFAFDRYLWLLNLAPNAESAMRSMYNRFFNQYRDRQLDWWRGDRSEPTVRWGSYLRDLDLNHELARLNPASRGEDARRFNRGARWISF